MTKPNLEELIKYIPYGKEHGVTKKELNHKLFNKSNFWLGDSGEYQGVLLLIHELRKKYIIFCDETTGKYYRSNDIGELNSFIKEQQYRAKDNSNAIVLAYEEIERLKESGNNEIH